MASRDLILDLIEQIEKNGHNYVIGIITPHETDKNQEKIEIFTNNGHSSLDKLLKVLKEYKKNKKDTF